MKVLCHQSEKVGSKKRGDTRMTKGLQPGAAIAQAASIARFSEEHCTSLVLTRRSRPDLQLLLGTLMYPCAPIDDVSSCRCADEGAIIAQMESYTHQVM